MNWDFPAIVFGLSSFGNHYEEVPFEHKCEMAKKWFDLVPGKVVLDTAGKYGAGLSLENLGKVLRELKIPSERVVISNKLAWKRVKLCGPEPTFEPGGTWVNIKHDAIQSISYEGILDCHKQGCELLGEPYRPKLLSVHDPDEYLASSTDKEDYQNRLNDIVDAYRALHELKAKGEIEGVDMGVKNWRVIREISERVDLDWIMLACSLTPYQHDEELLSLIEDFHAKGIAVVNSAVFNAGFLLGGDFFDYRKVDPVRDVELFGWREEFLTTCKELNVSAADVCVQFGMQFPGVVATALNTTKISRIGNHVQAVEKMIPNEVWKVLQDKGLIQSHCRL